MTDEERTATTARLIRNSKVVGCFMVASALACTWAMSLYDNKWWADLIPIVIWIANYVSITSMLAANQRLLLIHDLIKAKDWKGLSQFSAVPLERHTRALLMFDDPDRLYRR